MVEFLSPSLLPFLWVRSAGIENSWSCCSTTYQLLLPDLIAESELKSFLWLLCPCHNKTTGSGFDFGSFNKSVRLKAVTAIMINRGSITGATKQPGLLVRWRLQRNTSTHWSIDVISEMDTKPRWMVCALQVVSLTLFSQITMQRLEKRWCVR